mmetsp:Transcript_121423/g.388296  ORF Transcript_121423/g.388296 Transcript_121423/m.388296 type:complete len:204 (-) Transcript_121423:291-902(-)
MRPQSRGTTMQPKRATAPAAGARQAHPRTRGAAGRPPSLQAPVPARTAAGSATGSGRRRGRPLPSPVSGAAAPGWRPGPCSRRRQARGRNRWQRSRAQCRGSLWATPSPRPRRTSPQSPRRAPPGRAAAGSRRRATARPPRGQRWWGRCPRPRPRATPRRPCPSRLHTVCTARRCCRSLPRAPAASTASARPSGLRRAPLRPG